MGGSLPAEGSPLVVAHSHPLHGVEGACLLALGPLVAGTVLEVGAQEVEARVAVALEAQVDPAAGLLAAAALFLGPVS